MNYPDTEWSTRGQSQVPLAKESEKRGYFRVPAGRDVTIRNRSRFPGSETMKCHLEDLSFTGAKVTSAKRVGRQADKVELVLPVDEREAIFVPGDVLRVVETDDCHTTAILFSSMALSDQVRLDRVIKSYTREDNEPASPVSPFNKDLETD